MFVHRSLSRMSGRISFSSRMENLPNLAQYNDNTSNTLRYFTLNDIFDSWNSLQRKTKPPITRVGSRIRRVSQRGNRFREETRTRWRTVGNVIRRKPSCATRGLKGGWMFLARES